MARQLLGPRLLHTRQVLSVCNCTGRGVGEGSPHRVARQNTHSLAMLLSLPNASGIPLDIRGSVARDCPLSPSSFLELVLSGPVHEVILRQGSEVGCTGHSSPPLFRQPPSVLKSPFTMVPGSLEGKGLTPAGASGQGPCVCVAVLAITGFSL
jgi:hypothetical protein